MSYPPRDYGDHAMKRAGALHAMKRLQALCRGVRDTLVGPVSPTSEAVLAAVEALPDTKLWWQLTDEQRAPMERFLIDAEVEYHAERATDEIDQLFPHLKTIQ